MLNFIKYLEEQVGNHSIYVWGGQGEMLKTTSDSKIRNMETSTGNANRAIAQKNKVVAAGDGDVARLFDCSGLIVYWLMKEGLLGYDTTANGLRNLCTKIGGREGIKKGDFVFRVSNGNAYHVGVVVDDSLNVIEAKGRDEGVVKRALNASGTSYWNAYGRPDRFFAGSVPDEPTPEPAPTSRPGLSRTLKLSTPYMRGDDVQQAQRFLINAKCGVGSTGADGVFGGATKEAVEKYQEVKGLKVDGKIGQKTWESFGGKWG